MNFGSPIYILHEIALNHPTRSSPWDDLGVNSVQIPTGNTYPTQLMSVNNRRDHKKAVFSSLYIVSQVSIKVFATLPLFYCQ